MRSLSDPLHTWFLAVHALNTRLVQCVCRQEDISENIGSSIAMAPPLPIDGRVGMLGVTDQEHSTGTPLVPRVLLGHAEVGRVIRAQLKQS